MTVIDLSPGMLEYRTFGPAETDQSPVVFIHPVLTNGALWEPVAVRLVKHGIPSFVPTWPLGSHTIPLRRDADRSPAGVARMVSEFLASLDLRDVTLVGNDTGGAIAQYVLDSGDSRVGRAVLLNCDAFDTFPPFPIDLLLKPLEVGWLTRTLASLLRLRVVRHSWLGFGTLSKNMPPALSRSWIEPARTNPQIRADVVQFMRNVRPSELDEVTKRMANVTVPITVAWGMADFVFKPSLGRRLHAQFPSADFVEVPGARTLLALDAPDALTNAIVTIGKR